MYKSLEENITTCQDLDISTSKNSALPSNLV